MKTLPQKKEKKRKLGIDYNCTKYTYILNCIDKLAYVGGILYFVFLDQRTEAPGVAPAIGALLPIHWLLSSAPGDNSKLVNFRQVGYILLLSCILLVSTAKLGGDKKV